MTQALQAIHLEDYRPPEYLIDVVDLHVELHPTRTSVLARLQVRANPDCPRPSGTLHLDGRKLKLLHIKLDGRLLEAPPNQMFQPLP